MASIVERMSTQEVKILAKSYTTSQLRDFLKDNANVLNKNVRVKNVVLNVLKNRSVNKRKYKAKAFKFLETAPHKNTFELLYMLQNHLKTDDYGLANDLMYEHWEHTLERNPKVKKNSTR